MGPRAGLLGLTVLGTQSEGGLGGLARPPRHRGRAEGMRPGCRSAGARCPARARPVAFGRQLPGYGGAPGSPPAILRAGPALPRHPRSLVSRAYRGRRAAWPPRDGVGPGEAHAGGTPGGGGHREASGGGGPTGRSEAGAGVWGPVGVCPCGRLWAPASPSPWGDLVRVRWQPLQRPQVGTPSSPHEVGAALASERSWSGKVEEFLTWEILSIKPETFQQSVPQVLTWSVG